MDIRDQLAQIGVKYVYLVDKQGKEYKRYKTDENQKLLYIYRLMVQMLERISIKPDKQRFIEVGRKIRILQQSIDISLIDVFKDLEEINKLFNIN